MTFDTPFIPSLEADDKESRSRREESLWKSTGERNPDCDAREARAQELKVVGPSDEFLIEQLRHRNHDALALIFRRYARVVRSVAYRIIRDEAEADDLLQEVFLFIFRKWSLFDPSRGSARSWIVQVTYHRAIDRRRHLGSRRFYANSEFDETLIASEESMTGTAFYERSIEGALGVEALRKIEEELSDDQRRTIQLYFFDGYTFEEIAELTAQTVGNIRNHYYRGLERIRRLIFTGPLRGK